MAVLIGSARIDERGCASGGMSGDQGREVAIENYYVHPLGWYAMRAKDPRVATVLATAMAQACENSHIGYDQGQRLGVITQIKKFGNLAAINVNTECDCSSLVRACCIQAGFDPGNFTTYNECKALEATGKFEPRITVDANTKIATGDILVSRKKAHTVICVSGEPRTNKQEQSSSGSSSSNKPSKTPKWVGVVTAGLLNVRTWAGTENPNLKSYPYLASGNMVDVCDTVKAKDGSTWYYIRIGGKTYGFVSADYIRKA